MEMRQVATFTTKSFMKKVVEGHEEAPLEKPSETQDKVEYEDGVWYSTCDRECLKNEERIVIHIFSKVVDQGSAPAAELEAICEALHIEIGRRGIENKQIVIWCNSSEAVRLTNGKGTPWYRAGNVDILAKPGILRSCKLVLGNSNGEVTEHSGSKGIHVADSELHFSKAECNSGLNDIHQSHGLSLRSKLRDIIRE
ncbi:hypothetical protein Tco_1387812 [Tanacetum coccineum]